MTNEAVIVELLGNKGDPVRYTCADGTTILKGTLLELTTPRTVVANSDADRPFVGIAAMEKVADDGTTSISVYTHGIFQIMVLAGGTQAEIGDGVSLTNTENQVSLSDTLDNEKGYEVGYAIETIAVGEFGMVKIHK